MSQPATQDLLLAVQLSFTASEHDNAILDLAANHHPTQLVEQFQRSIGRLKQIMNVSIDEQRKAFQEEATKAEIIVQAVNKVTDVMLIDEEQPLSQAKGNLMRLEEQLTEVSNQMGAIAGDASDEALQKLCAEKLQLSQQMLTAQDIVMQVLAAPAPQLRAILEDQKDTII